MRTYSCISTDDHLQEAPDTWTSRMSARTWGDLIPTPGDDPDLADSANGGAGWYIGGVRKGFVSVNGAMPDRTRAPRTWDEVPDIAVKPAERVKAMDADGVDAHTLHPNFTQTMMNDPSLAPDLRLAIMRAYNDFIMEEYGDAFPGRFILLAQVPYWGPDEAVAELRRCMARSSQVRGINFGFPHAFGYAHICDPVWDALWEALQEADLPLHLHIGSGNAMGMGPETWSGYEKTRAVAERSTKAIAAHTTVATTLLFSGIFERFPRLKVVFAETGAGWVPYLLDVADHQWERQHLADMGMPAPSTIFRENCFANFWFEHIDDGLRASGLLSNVMWLSDFPHPTCTWPTSRQYLDKSLSSVNDAERYAVMAGNARRVYRLPEGY